MLLCSNWTVEDRGSSMLVAAYAPEAVHSNSLSGPYRIRLSAKPAECETLIHLYVPNVLLTTQFICLQTSYILSTLPRSEKQSSSS